MRLVLPRTSCILYILNGSDDGIYYSELVGVCTLSIVWYSKKNTREHVVSKTGCFLPQVWGTSTLLGLLERANLNAPSPEGRNTSRFRHFVFSIVFWNTRRWTKSIKPRNSE
jgi:hypothetical protein